MGGGGGVRSYLIDSKSFQLVVEEGGRFFLLRIFERGKFAMRSVFMCKNAAHWLMFCIEHFVVGKSFKQFFTLREGDTAFTLQWCSNSSGQFLLLTELKAGGLRRSIIIPEGKERYGWRVFGLELRKLLFPSQYAVDGNGPPKFIPQARKYNLKDQNSRTFAEVVQGFHGRTEDRKQLSHPGLTAKEKLTQLGKEKKGENLKLSGAKVGEIPVSKYERLEVVGRSWKEQRLSEVAEVGKQKMADTRLHFPSFLNSKADEKGKKSDFRKSCWSRRGLVIEVDVIGRRRVSWVRKKGGVSKIRGKAREVEWECITDASKVLNWAPQGTKQEALRPGLGRGTSPMMGSFYSGPSLFEMGESSLAGEGKSAQVLAIEACPKARH